jgi:hypothetical protein
MKPAPQSTPPIQESAKPVESFPLQADPLTGWEIEPAQYRKCIPVYDRDSGELKEFIL